MLRAGRIWGVLATYAECGDLLRRILNEDLAEALSRMVELGNIFVHESVDPERLYELLNRLDDFRRFAEQIQTHLL